MEEWDLIALSNAKTGWVHDICPIAWCGVRSRRCYTVWFVWSGGSRQCREGARSTALTTFTCASMYDVVYRWFNRSINGVIHSPRCPGIKIARELQQIWWWLVKVKRYGTTNIQPPPTWHRRKWCAKMRIYPYLGPTNGWLGLPIMAWWCVCIIVPALPDWGHGHTLNSWNTIKSHIDRYTTNSGMILFCNCVPCNKCWVFEVLGTHLIRVMCITYTHHDPLNTFSNHATDFSNVSRVGHSEM